MYIKSYIWSSNIGKRISDGEGENGEFCLRIQSKCNKNLLLNIVHGHIKASKVCVTTLLSC